MAAGKAKTEREKISILTMTEKAKAEARLINYLYKVRQLFGLKIIYLLLFIKISQPYFKTGSGLHKIYTILVRNETKHTFNNFKCQVYSS